MADPLAFAALALLAAGLAAGLRALRGLGRAGAGYKAKVLASAVFVSGRRADDVLREDVRLDSYRILRLFRARVDERAKSVTVRFLGLFAPRTAVFRPGLGCALADRGRLAGPAALPVPEAASPAFETAPAPEALTRAVDAAFAEPDPRRLRRTRAVLVVQDGRLLAERYAPGFGPDTPLCGWSMSKSVLGTVVGAAVGQGLVRLDERGLLPEWRGPGDPRARIELEDLLRMRSGLAFDETYADPLSDVTQMLFAEPDAARFAAERPPLCRPGAQWKYASGTSNILSRALRRALERAGRDYPAFPREALFAPLGMARAVFETDAAGTFVGSSFVYATAREWARLGQLHLADGVWEGRRLLPAGWVSLVTAPTPQSPDGCYGAHWWLRVAREMGGESEAARRLPPDAYHALGHEGQCLSVVPSRRLVVVRLGLSVYIDAWNHAEFLDAVLASVNRR